MSKYVNPMPASVRVATVSGTSTTIFECEKCKQASHYPRAHYLAEGGFLALYDRLQELAWEHNMSRHVKRTAPVQGVLFA